MAVKKRRGTRRPEDYRAKLERNLDTVFSNYIRKRDRYSCVQTGEQRCISISHVLSQTKYKNTRWDERNAFVLANRLHKEYHEADPYLFMDWYIEKYGKEQFDALREEAYKPTKYRSIQELIEMTNQLVKKTLALPSVRTGNGKIK